MANREDGGPAFPIGDMHGEGGMSLRDYFAASALSGALKDHENTKRMYEMAEQEGIPVAEYIARSVFNMADAMLAERAK